MNAVLIALLLLPLAGAAATLVPFGADRAAADRRALRFGTGVTGATLALAVALAVGFDQDRPAVMQAVTNVRWIPAIDVRLHLGVDGISLPLLVLTALLTFLCALYSYFKMPARACPPRGRSPACCSCWRSACWRPSRCSTWCCSSWRSRSC